MMDKIIFPFMLIFLPKITTAQNIGLKPATDSSIHPWTFSVTGYYSILPGSSNTTTLIGYADYKALHLEPRYNYEGQNTGSFFAGWKFEAEGKINFAATPLIGIVFGNLNGMAPGLELEVSYKLLDFYSETEYLFDFSDNQSDYLYTWTELGISPLHSFRTGISAQRTRLYQTGLDFQRGVFAEYSFWKLTLGFHYFNPFTDDHFFIASVKFAL
jgi:hypothetical protein